MLLDLQRRVLAPDLSNAQFATRTFTFLNASHSPMSEPTPAPAPIAPGIYTLTDVERYASLSALYSRWFERTGDEYHEALAAHYLDQAQSICRA